MARIDPRGAAGGAVAAGLLGAVVTGALTARTARRMASPHAPRPTAVQGVEAGGTRIRLRATPDALLPGSYSFWFADGRGHARLGDVVGRDGGTVLREVLGVDRGELASAREGRFNGWMWLDPAGIGLPYRSERVQTTAGSVPAWVVPGGDGSRWAVLVHGRASVRQESLRAVPAFHAAGCTVLVPAYRGDGEAADADQGGYPLADAEWIDVESAILHALDGGATEVVLAGWSSGASIVLATAHRSRVRSVISQLVLDSPVLDGAETLLARGDGPEPLRRGALTLLSSRWGGLVVPRGLEVDPAGRADPAELTVPVLILQSDDDGVAPPVVAQRFAAARPDLVRLVRFRGARHTRLWNLDRAAWETAVLDFLREGAARPDQAGRSDQRA